MPLTSLEHMPPDKEKWKEIFDAFCVHLGVRNFHFVGYSMGGRVAMVTALLFPERTQSLLLLAPDGLKINRIYQFASGTRLGRKIYKGIIGNPKSLFGLAAFLNKVGILNDKLHRFVHVHLDTTEKRQLVYDAWLAHRFLFPDLDALANWMDHSQKPVYFVFGEYDSVIRVRLGIRFSGKVKMPKEKWLFTMPLGHRLLEQKTIESIKEKKLSFY